MCLFWCFQISTSFGKNHFVHLYINPEILSLYFNNLTINSYELVLLPLVNGHMTYRPKKNILCFLFNIFKTILNNLIQQSTSKSTQKYFNQTFVAI